MDWIGLSQDKDKDKWRALVKVVMNLQVPHNAEKFLSGCTTSGLSSNAQVNIVSDRSKPSLEESPNGHSFYIHHLTQVTASM
jgi:hypothetical protein